jgi:hypothetical protein
MGGHSGGQYQYQQGRQYLNKQSPVRATLSSASWVLSLDPENAQAQVEQQTTLHHRNSNQTVAIAPSPAPVAGAMNQHLPPRHHIFPQPQQQQQVVPFPSSHYGGQQAAPATSDAESDKKGYANLLLAMELGINVDTPHARKLLFNPCADLGAVILELSAPAPATSDAESDKKVNANILLAMELGINVDTPHARKLLFNPCADLDAVILELSAQAVLGQEIDAMVQSANDKFIYNNPALQRFCVETIAIDDIEVMAKNMSHKQGDFMQTGVSGYVGKLRDW